MELIKVRIVLYKNGVEVETKDVKGEIVAPGLALTRSTDPFFGWALTHIASGKHLRYRGDKRRMRRFAATVASLTDWTLPEDELLPLIKKRRFKQAFKAAAKEAGLA